jgi:GAF domain-containing protein
MPEALVRGEQLLVEEADFDARLDYPDAARKEGIVAIFSVPLKVRDTVPGVLRLYSSEKWDPTDDEMDILMKFAEQAARAIENAMAYEQVRSDIEGLKKHIPKREVQGVNK